MTVREHRMWKTPILSAALAILLPLSGASAQQDGIPGIVNQPPYGERPPVGAYTLQDFGLVTCEATAEVPFFAQFSSMSVTGNTRSRWDRRNENGIERDRLDAFWKSMPLKASVEVAGCFHLGDVRLLSSALQLQGASNEYEIDTVAHLDDIPSISDCFRRANDRQLSAVPQTEAVNCISHSDVIYLDFTNSARIYAVPVRWSEEMTQPLISLDIRDFKIPVEEKTRFKRTEERPISLYIAFALTPDNSITPHLLKEVEQ